MISLPNVCRVGSGQKLLDLICLNMYRWTHAHVHRDIETGGAAMSGSRAMWQCVEFPGGKGHLLSWLDELIIAGVVGVIDEEGCTGHVDPVTQARQGKALHLKKAFCVEKISFLWRDSNSQHACAACQAYARFTYSAHVHGKGQTACLPPSLPPSPSPTCL